MNVILDNNALVHLLNPRARRDTRARLKGLLRDVEESRGRLLIPTPVLTEYLSHALEQALRQKLMAAFRTSRWVGVVPYDELASDECAAMHIRAKESGDKRAPLAPDTPWQSVKIDRQIVAIAKVRGADIVTGDDDVLRVAKWAGVRAIRVEELTIPESERQLVIEGVAPHVQAPRSTRKRPTKPPPALPHAAMGDDPS